MDSTSRKLFALTRMQILRDAVVHRIHSDALVYAWYHSIYPSFHEDVYAGKNVIIDSTAFDDCFAHKNEEVMRIHNLISVKKADRIGKIFDAVPENEITRFGIKCILGYLMLNGSLEELNFQDMTPLEKEDSLIVEGILKRSSILTSGEI